MNDQTRLRKTIRSQRRALSPEQRRQAARHVARHITHLAPFRRARDVAFYLAFDGECDPDPIRQLAERRGKHCYLPVLGDHGYAGMWFAPVADATRFRSNYYGIPEPIHRRSDRRAAQQLDMIIVPLVAFDGFGHRIGMGGGYYDRTLAFTARRRPWHRPLLVGLAYGFQQVPRINVNPWDVALDLIVTPNEIVVPKHTGGRRA